MPIPLCTWLVLLICLWLPSQASGQSKRPPEALPDVVRVTVDGNTKAHEGRLVRVSLPREVWFLDGSRIEEVELPEGAAVVVDSQRTRLADWMGRRRPGQSAAEMFALVGEAERAGLFHMAHLQAIATVLIDPDYDQAQAYLGNKRDRERGAYEWRVGRKTLVQAAYLEYIKQEWSQRVYLESEHYRIQTDAGLDVAVNTLFDLEALYLHWMSGLGQELLAGEDALDLDRHKMALKVFKDRFNEGYDLIINKNRPAVYDPSLAFQFDFEDRWGQKSVSSNVLYTYVESGQQRPFDLVSLGTQQLLWTTLFFSHRKGQHDFPFEDRVRSKSHWLEIGLGYYLQRTFTGPPGFLAAATATPLLEPAVKEAAQAKLSSNSPIKNQNGKNRMKEITNLIGFPFEGFYNCDRLDALAITARAKAWVTYLMHAAPTPDGCTNTGRTALLHYIRQAFGTASGPTGPSSAVLDEAFNPTRRIKVIERLQDPYTAWLQTQ